MMTNVTATAVKELRTITGVAMMDCKKALVECNGDLEAAQEFLRKKGQAQALKKSSRNTNEGLVATFLSEDQKSAVVLQMACETDFVARNEKFQKLVQRIGKQALQFGCEFLEKQILAGTELMVEEAIRESIAELGENIQLLKTQRFEIESGVIGAYTHNTGKIGVLVPLKTDPQNSTEDLKILAKDIAMHIAATPAEAVQPEQVESQLIEREKKILTEQALESGKPAEIVKKMIEGRIQKFLKEICVESQPFVKDPQITIAQLIAQNSKKLGVTITFENFAKLQF